LSSREKNVAEEKAKVEATPFEKFEHMARRVFSASKRKAEEHKRDSNNAHAAVISKAKGGENG
jgi:hypothetical protein